MKDHMYVVVSTNYDPDSIGQDPYVQLVCESHATALRWIGDVLKKQAKNHSQLIYYTIIKTEFIKMWE